MPDARRPRERELLLVPVYGDAIWGGGMVASALGVHVRMVALAWDRLLGRGVGASVRIPVGTVPDHDISIAPVRAARDLLVGRGVWRRVEAGYLIGGFEAAVSAMEHLRAGGR